MPEKIQREGIDLAMQRGIATEITAQVLIHSTRGSTLQILAKSLHNFSERYRRFFKNGLADHQGFTFDSGSSFPTGYVLRLISDQIGHDLDVLLRINGQRSLGEQFPLIGQALRIADELAYRALQPAIDVKLLRPTTVITYLEKSAHIRVIPYAPVALIGFPFRTLAPLKAAIAGAGPASLPQDAVETAVASADDQFNDLLALPHEIGHYLYWHAPLYSQTMRNPLEHYLRQQPAWLRDWNEEIYADVYSCLIGGPLIAHNFQKVLITDSPEGLLHNDGSHPASALRGFVYVDTLKALGRFPNAYKALDEQWRKWLQPLGIDGSTHLPLAGDKVTSIDEARVVVSELVRTILATALFKVFHQIYQLEPATGSAQVIWSQDLSLEGAPLDDLYSQFVPTLAQQSVPELALEGEDEQFYRLEEATDKILLDHLELGKTQTWLDEFMEQQAAKLPFNIPLPLWTAALKGLGWLTGPTGPGNVKTLVGETS